MRKKKLYAARPAAAIPKWEPGMSAQQYIQEFDRLNNLKPATYQHSNK